MPENVLFLFFFPPHSNQHVPALWIGPAKSFIQFAKFIMLQQRYLTLKSGDYCCSDFSVSLYISQLTSVHPLRVGYSV